jgi:hypothetical protein
LKIQCFLRFTKNSPTATKKVLALDSLTFGSSKDMLPLQAADLFTWEVYQHGRDIMASRAEAGKPIRSGLRKLARSGRMVSQFADYSSISALAERRAKDNPHTIANIAAYFKTVMA